MARTRAVQLLPIPDEVKQPPRPYPLVQSISVPAPGVVVVIGDQTIAEPVRAVASLIEPVSDDAPPAAAG